MATGHPLPRPLTLMIRLQTAASRTA